MKNFCNAFNSYFYIQTFSFPIFPFHQACIMDQTRPLTWQCTPWPDLGMVTEFKLCWKVYSEIWYRINFSKKGFLLVVLYSVHLLTWFGDEVNSLNLQDNGEWTAWSGKWGCSIWGETFSFLLIFAFLIFSFTLPAEWKIWKEWPIQLKMES